MKSEVQKKIEELEREGTFDVDIEADPPGRELMPDEIEYVKRTLWQRVKTRFAFFLAYRFAAREKRKKRFIVNEIIGAENLALSGGVILTANHFSPLDSFIIHRTFDASKRKGRFYRVIKESNYTSFPGFYGFLMRNCNTLPLSSNLATMRKFLRGVDTLLKRGECVLVYPEQSMWYNYRKPRPLKIGAFEMAVRADVPVVPCFITMAGSEYIGADGTPVQEHTVHVGAPIYPDLSLHKKDRAEKMMRETFEFNKSTYESFYGIALTYEK
jgi:1-acyl-sn-glycerol-3-phosphate acyltransferase